MMDMSAQLKNDLKNPWLQAIIGTVAVTVCVNLAYIAYAFWSPPALVAKDYYERGKSYFHEEIQRERAAGDAWRLQLLAPEQPRINQVQTYRLYVMDRQGNPLHSGQAILYVYRPGSDQSDFKQDLKYADAGTYAAEISFPLPGNWDLIAQVKSGEQKYDVAQRIYVQR